MLQNFRVFCLYYNIILYYVLLMQYEFGSWAFFVCVKYDILAWRVLQYGFYRFVAVVVFYLVFFRCIIVVVRFFAFVQNIFVIVQRYFIAFGGFVLVRICIIIQYIPSYVSSEKIHCFFLFFVGWFVLLSDSSRIRMHLMFMLGTLLFSFCVCVSVQKCCVGQN